MGTSAKVDERRYTNAHHDGDTITLYYRDDGELKEQHVRAEWVAFFVLKDVSAARRRALEDSTFVRTVREVGSWLRVAFTDQWTRKKLCYEVTSPILQDGLVAYEADVNPIRRWFSDTGALVARPMRVYLDIETDSRKTITQMKAGDARVLCWTLVSASGETFHAVLAEDTDEAEKKLLRSLWAQLEAFDQVVAWMSPMVNDDFDFSVIEQRSERLGVAADARRWVWLDHLKAYEKLNKNAAESGEEKRSLKLQAIAMAEVGEGKDDFDASRTWHAWAAGGEERRTLSKYNVKDTHLLLKIEEKTGYLELFATMCEVCRLFGETASLQPIRQMDGFMLRLGFERDVRFASKRYKRRKLGEVEEEQFAGAIVFEPKMRGIERDIHVIDFASLYPSIMITWNMSPDTKAPRGVVPPTGPIPEGYCRAPGTGQGFSTAKPGILIVALLEMINMRAKWSKLQASLPPGTPEAKDAGRKSMAYKVMANSFYGGTSSVHSRYNDPEIGEAVTQTGVWLIKKTNAVGERQFALENKYGDTDSLFFKGAAGRDPKVDELVDYCNREVYPGIVAKQGCKENRIKIAYEKSFARIVMGEAKKRYIGRYAFYKDAMAKEDSKPEVKGFEYKRGDASLLTAHLQAEVIDMLVGGLKVAKCKVPTERLEDYHDVIVRARRHVLDEPLPIEEVVVTKGLSKPIEEYAQKVKKDGTDAAQPPQVVCAKILLARGQEVGEGSRVEYLVADGSTSPMRVIPAEDYREGEGNVDRFYVWESMVFPATQRLLEAAFPEHDWKAWLKVRPKKVRKGKKLADVLPGQMELPATPRHDMVAPTIGASPRAPERFRFVVDEGAVRDVGTVKDVLARHPGDKPVTLVVRTLDGAEAVLYLRDVRVRESSALRAELAQFSAA